VNPLYAPTFGMRCTILTNPSEWRTGSCRSRVASKKLNITVLAPIPRARSPVTRSVNPGFLASIALHFNPGFSIGGEFPAL